MPYIPKKDRSAAKDMPLEAGDLAYDLTTEILDHIKMNKQEHMFDVYAKAIGVVELVKMELWRRLVVPYECKKRELEGDVY